MADQQDGAGVLRQHLLQQVERLQVQVVGRLVQDEQVGRARHRAGQQQPAALAARQLADRRARLLRLEQEVLHVADDVTLLPGHLDLVAVAAGQRVLQAARRVERRALLVQRHRLQVGAERHPAAIRRVAAGQQAQQRGLAGAVRAHDAEPVPAQHPQRQVGHDHAVAVGAAGVLGDDDLLAAHLALGRGELQPGRRPAALAPFLPQRRQLRHPAHVALAPGGHAVGDPVLLAHDLAVELLAVARVLLGHLLAPRLEMLEAAVHPAGDTALEPHHRAAQRLQQAAVVADEHDAGALARQLLLQPLDRRQVQVVGRLVQQEQVGLRRQRPGQRRAARLPARQPRRVFRPGQAQPVEQGHRAVRVVIGAEPGLDVVERRGEARQVRLLRKVADGGARLHEAGAAVRQHEPGRDLEQGRLAGAVAPDEADALAGAHADGGAIEQGLGAECRADVLQQQEGRSHARCVPRAGSRRKPVSARPTPWR